MANLDFYGLFDYQAGDTDTYEYTATEFNEFYKSITTTGIVKDRLNEMAVSLNGLGVSVATGFCFIEGRLGKIASPKPLTLVSTGSAHKDRIVLKLDIPNRKITVDIKQGGATPPELTQNATVWEISLAQINVPASGVSTTMVDERNFFYTPTQVMNKMNAITGGTEFVYAVYA